ncbi:unnamed protein product, partial [Cyprideis torosa]
MFGETFCDLWMSMDVMCCTCSIMSLCAISLDRYIYIEDPLSYGRYMSKKTVMLIVAGIWLVAGLISFLPITLGIHKPDAVEIIVRSSTPAPSTEDPAGPPFPIDSLPLPVSSTPPPPPPKFTECALNLSPTYAVASSAISFYIPCVIMVVLYGRLYQKVSP